MTMQGEGETSSDDHIDAGSISAQRNIKLKIKSCFDLFYYTSHIFFIKKVKNSQIAVKYIGYLRF